MCQPYRIDDRIKSPSKMSNLKEGNLFKFYTVGYLGFRSYSNPKAFVNFLLPPLIQGEGWGGVKNFVNYLGLPYLKSAVTKLRADY